MAGLVCGGPQQVLRRLKQFEVWSAPRDEISLGTHRQPGNRSIRVGERTNVRSERRALFFSGVMILVWRWRGLRLLLLYLWTIMKKYCTRHILVLLLCLSYSSCLMTFGVGKEKQMAHRMLYPSPWLPPRFLAGTNRVRSAPGTRHQEYFLSLY